MLKSERIQGMFLFAMHCTRIVPRMVQLFFWVLQPKLESLDFILHLEHFFDLLFALQVHLFL